MSKSRSIVAKKRPTDVNQLGKFMVDKLSGSSTELTVPSRSEISRIMSAMGRKGGKKSAKARMEKIAPEARREIALKAARARWAKKQPAAHA
jgi:hypothetical protein